MVHVEAITELVDSSGDLWDDATMRIKTRQVAADAYLVKLNALLASKK